MPPRPRFVALTLPFDLRCPRLRFEDFTAAVGSTAFTGRLQSLASPPASCVSGAFFGPRFADMTCQHESRSPAARSALAVGDGECGDRDLARARSPRRHLHTFKYRLALVSEGVCVMRYDNEAGKGDHKHVGDWQIPYRFIDLNTLQADFWADVEAWSAKL